MITIRQAMVEDYPKVAEFVKSFQQEVIDSFGLWCDDKVLWAIMPKLKDYSLVMLDDNKVVGVIAGFVTRYHLNNSCIFQEVLFYVKPEYRRYSIKLLKALEKKCKDWNINQVIMAYFGNNGVGKFYEQHGYRFLEAHFIKNLEGG